MKVAYSSAARRDLIEIGAWIEQDNPVRADSFVNELQEACDSLVEMPRAFPPLLQHPESAIRRRPFERYLIFYRVRSDRVEILRVLHGARDYETLLFP